MVFYPKLDGIFYQSIVLQFRVGLHFGNLHVFLDQVQLQPSIPKMEVRVEHIGFEGWSRALIVHDNTPIEVGD